VLWLSLFVVIMNWETLFTLFIQGAFLIIGIYIGERITMKGFEKRLTKMANKSETVQRLLKLINNPDLEKDVNSLLKKATKFFDEATVLVKKGTELAASPEAKNFFKNATVLIEQFSSESPKLLEMPKKP